MLCRILDNEPISAGVYDLRAELPVESPVPGTFLHIACGKKHVLRRPISLCGHENGAVRLVYAVKGEGTQWLSRRRPGEMLDVLGPLGSGFDCRDDIPTLLVGGGLGVPPMLYCTKTLTKTRALLGFRDKNAVILDDEFPDSEVFTDDGSAGTKGYPHIRLDELLGTGEWARVFACGPRPMLRAVGAVCAQHDMPCFVSMEERMACGVGACLVCACAVGGEYKRVCRDGPVFSAGEVNWDE